MEEFDFPIDFSRDTLKTVLAERLLGSPVLVLGDSVPEFKGSKYRCEEQTDRDKN